MGKLVITVDLDNEATENPGEVAKLIKDRVVKDVANLPQWPLDHNFNLVVFDANGNRVGAIVYDRFA